MELPLLDLPTSTGLLVGLIVVLLAAALAGTAGFVALVHRRQIKRIATLVEQLATGGDTSELAPGPGLHDPRLRAGFERLAERIALTWTLATHDQLTEVANRQTLLTQLDSEIERAARYDRQLSIVMIDIDHFKRVNDTHGHLAGDLVLRQIAQAVQDSVRRVDILGRYGGEEFMVILPETDVDAAASIAEKIRRLAGRVEVVLPDGTVVGVTLSAGVAGGLGAHLLLDALIRDADAALYTAKALGRDQVYVFREVDDDRQVRRAAITPAAREHAMDVGRAAMNAATDSLAQVLGARAGWAGGPSTMIAESAAAVAHALGLPEGEIERIRTASLLHDLGKLAIPDEILSKPSGLNETEWRVVTEHPKIGQVVLEQAGALRDAATIVLHHHEWYDGRGYPHGLTGQQIPVGARIVAVSDAYEAMVSGRPYRTAITHQRALDELRRHAGRQFDPEVVEQFARIFAAGVPWALSGDHGHAHPHPHDGHAGVGHTGDGHARDGDTNHAADDDEVDNGAIHDALHARRLGVVPLGRDGSAATLGAVTAGLDDATDTEVRTGTAA